MRPSRRSGLEFEQLADSLREFLDEVTERVIAEAMGKGSQEAEVQESRAQLE